MLYSTLHHLSTCSSERFPHGFIFAILAHKVFRIIVACYLLVPVTSHLDEAPQGEKGHGRRSFQSRNISSID